MGAMFTVEKCLFEKFNDISKLDTFCHINGAFHIFHGKLGIKYY